VAHQDEVVPQLEPGMVPSTIDPDAAGRSKAPKRPVRISAWKLAKLDSSEAMKAAAKARASSSVLKPLENRRQQAADYSSSEISIQSSVSTDMGANKDTKGDLRISSMRNSIGPSLGSRDEYETGTHSMSSFSSPSHTHEPVTLSPLPGLMAISIHLDFMHLILQLLRLLSTIVIMYPLFLQALMRKMSAKRVVQILCLPHHQLLSFEM